MRTRNYSCPNGCKLPPRKKELTEIGGHEFVFAYSNFNYCPVCGSLMPDTRKKYKDIIDIYHLHPKLKNVERLFLNSEFNSAAREAFIIVETVLREKSGLDLHGFDLATKALKFEVDKQTGEVIKQPLISINSLKNESEKNEQDGIRYMLMGFFQGIRNLYQHNQVESGPSYVFTIILNASFFLHLLDGNSIMSCAKVIRAEISYRDIYNNMHKRMDRVRLLHLMKKKQHYIEKNRDKEEENNGTSK